LESWDTYLAGTSTLNRGIRPTFFSFNHLPFGAVGEWIWRYIAGINPDDNNPGFQNIIIEPQPGAGITNVYSSFISIHGPIVSMWTNNTGSSKYSLSVTIPANVTASVYLPSSNLTSIVEGGIPATNAPGLLYYYTTNAPNFTNGASLFTIGSGTYQFTVSNIHL
jgi:alpha-L-rhamnosidase